MIQRKKREIKKKETPVIHLTKSIEDILNEYFDYLFDYLDANEDYLSSKDELSYLLMKRFLDTTYKNLFELDHKVFAEELLKYKHAVIDAYNVYLDFNKRVKSPQIAYDRIFLKRQDEYIQIIKKIEENRHTISYLDTTLNMVTAQIENLKESLRETEPDTIFFENRTIDLKLLKKREVDVIHNLATKKEENTTLIKVANEFKQRHQQEFDEALEEFINYFNPKLESVLNTIAYLYDQQLWKKAQGSTSIKKFLRDSNIQGSIDSKTYLRYYVKRLDKQKLSVEQQKLVKLLIELESVEKTSFAFLTQDKKLVEQYSAQIDLLTSKKHIQVYENHKHALPKLLKKHPNMIIVEKSIFPSGAKEFLKDLKKYMKDDDFYNIGVILVCDEVTDEMVEYAEEAEVSSILDKEATYIDIKETIKELLDEIM